MISFIIWLSYILYIYFTYKPDCISKSYYLTKHRNVFSIWLCLVAITLFPCWVDITPDMFLFLPFLSTVALCIVGLCPKYLSSDRKAHIIASSVTCVLSVIWSILMGFWYIPLILAIGVILLWFSKVLDKFYWTECIGFLNIYLSIFLCI